ncbi:MAG: hypothetical protein CW338_10450 [Clostridiales bacterium]|nr:hypothetical protein [Clostridiales bacterium]
MKKALKQLPLMMLLLLPFIGAAYAFAEDLRIEHAADIAAPVTLGFILLAAGAMLWYLIRCMKKQPYSYKNAAMVGGLLYLLFIIAVVFIPVCALNRKHSEETFMVELLQNIMISVKYFINALMPVLILLFVSLTVSNIALVRHEGKSPKNMLGAALGAFMIIFTVLNILGWNRLSTSRMTDDGSGNPFGQVLLRLVPIVTGGVLCYLECVFTGMCVCAVAAAKKRLKYDMDYMIILGCAIRKDGTLYPLLRGRVDHAEAFARRQYDEKKKKLVFVPRGGQGEDECISEAEAMRRYLEELGIDPERILAEDKSTNTRENMRFSKQLIEQQDPSAKVAFSTTNYHVFRAGVYAAEEGLKAVGTGSRTKWYFWPNAFVREFFALLKARKWTVLMNIAAIDIFCIIVSLVSWHVIKL